MTQNNKTVAGDATNPRQPDTQLDAWSLAEQVTSLTSQALNGRTQRDRHLALCRLLITLDGVSDLMTKDNLVGQARESAIKHAVGLTDTIAALLTNQTPSPVEGDELDEIPINPQRSSVSTEDTKAAPDQAAPPHVETDEVYDTYRITDDAEISKLAATLSRKAQESMQHMAEAMRGGASPYDAFLKVVGGEFLSVVNSDIPQARYEGMSLKAWQADTYARAKAIIDDETDRYDEETKNAIQYAQELTLTPGNETTTDLTSEGFRELIKRAEGGEHLDADQLFDDDDRLRDRDEDEAETEHVSKTRELYEFDEETGVRRLTPYAGMEGVAEIERLAKASLQDGEDQQHLAVLELLTHIMPHDGSGWAMYARNAIMAESTELLDTAADLLVVNAQRKRGIVAPAPVGVADNGSHDHQSTDEDRTATAETAGTEAFDPVEAADMKPDPDEEEDTAERVPLRADEMQHLVSTLLRLGDDTNGDHRTAALLLLFDELEDTSDLALQVSRRAFADGYLGDVVRKYFVARLRENYAGADEGSLTLDQALDSCMDDFQE